MLYSLGKAKPTLAKLKGKGKPYDALIAIILRLDPEGDTPTGKALQAELGISASVFKRWLDTLHADFFTLLETDPGALTFPQLEHLICVQARDRSLCFLCRLPHTPRVGEGMSFPFLLGIADTTAFYVDSVSYEYEQDKTTAIIQLKDGYFNSYLWHLQDKARFERTLTYKLETELSSYRKEEYLRKVYPPSKETLDAYWKEQARQAEEKENRKKKTRRS